MPTKPPRNSSLDRELKKFIKENRPRAGSFIVTLFGDVISQHGNCVWLGSIIECLESFGLNSRQIRTAVGRLVQENWLQSKQIGRRSFFSLTDSGLNQFQRAARRIYADEPSPWDGYWTLVLLAQLEPILRDRVRRELVWLGFGQVNANSFAHPRADRKALSELISERDLSNQLFVMRSATDTLTTQKTVEKITFQAWNLAEIKPRYETFCRVFQTTLEALSSTEDHNPQQMFELRLIMIHEYRRLLLKTTELPRDLLPKHWPGAKALDIAKAVYTATSKGSLTFIETNLQATTGVVGSVGEAFYERFS